MKKILLILLACSIGIGSMMQSIPAYADNTCTVSGTVKDANGSPIVGALVIIYTYDTPRTVVASAVTDVTGNYTMSVPIGTYGIWQVSAVGYVQMEGIPFVFSYPTLVLRFILQEDPTE